MNIEFPYDNDSFLRAALRLPVERTPLWIMRQAGRYLPEYREVRSKTDFQTLYKTPELAAEVTIQPVDILGVDAAIIFSDILVIPEVMGMRLAFVEGDGPVFDSPLRSDSDIRNLKTPVFPGDLRYVFDAITMAKELLQGRVPLIGFCGSPWTLATYMVEGGKTKNFERIKTLLYNSPSAMHRLLHRLADAAAEFLIGQIESGAAAVQIFDTWGGILAADEYRAFSLEYVSRIVEKVRRPGVPVIYFSRGTGQHLQHIIDTGVDVLGIDWTADLKSVREIAGAKAALQGNLDPVILFAEPEIVRQETCKILNRYGAGTGHIFNLGHGILPDTPVENVKEMINTVRRHSPAFHDKESVQA